MTVYGYEHRKLRERWRQRVEAGQVACACGCGLPIQPGEAWDLAHDPMDPTGKAYLGPARAKHNRATAGRERKMHRARRRRWVNPAW